MRLPRHIGIIPDGNRRWALDRGMEKPDGYKHGISPGMTLYHMCRQLGIEEMSFYGFTVDNTKRPSARHLQKHAWRLWRNCQRKMPACLYWAIPSPPCFLRNFLPIPGAMILGLAG